VGTGERDRPAACAPPRRAVPWGPLFGALFGRLPVHDVFLWGRPPDPTVRAPSDPALGSLRIDQHLSARASRIALSRFGSRARASRIGPATRLLRPRLAPHTRWPAPARASRSGLAHRVTGSRFAHRACRPAPRAPTRASRLAGPHRLAPRARCSWACASRFPRASRIVGSRIAGSCFAHCGSRLCIGFALAFLALRASLLVGSRFAYRGHGQALRCPSGRASCLGVGYEGGCRFAPWLSGSGRGALRPCFAHRDRVLVVGSRFAHRVVGLRLALRASGAGAVSGPDSRSLVGFSVAARLCARASGGSVVTWRASVGRGLRRLAWRSGSYPRGLVGPPVSCFLAARRGRAPGSLPACGRGSCCR